MRKGTKILISTVCGIVAVVILAVAALFLPPVQRFVAHRAAGWLGTKLDATVGFEQVRVRPVGVVSFDGLYAIDNQGDTLLYGHVNAHVGLVGGIDVRRVKLSDGKADIALIISRFKGGGGRFEIERTEMHGMDLKYDTLRFGDVSLEGRDFVVDGKDIHLNINELSLSYHGERVALSVPGFAAAAGRLTLDGAQLAAAGTHLRFGQLRFDFATKILNAKLINSTVSLPELTLKELNANILGTVYDFTAKVDFETGEATRFTGSGRWRRQAEIFTLRTDTLVTAAADIEKIMPLITKKQLPDSLSRILRRLQQITITGNFSGDRGILAANVNVVTGLGPTHINLSLSSNNTLNGEVTLQDFDLGRFFAVQGLGRTTATAMIAGPIANIDISNITYKGHDYQYIMATAQLENGRLSASARTYDPNLTLTLGVESSPRSEPSYNFDLDVIRADLRALGFDRRKKTSLLSFKARGNFGANTSATVDNILYISDLDSIQPGKIELIATSEYQTASSDLTLLSALVPGLDIAGGSLFTATRRGGITTFRAQAAHLRKDSATISRVRLEGHANADTITLAGNFDVGKQHWKIGADKIIPEQNKLNINNLSLESAGQRLSVSGTASQNAGDTLTISAQNFDLTPLSDILRIGHRIAGRASGKAMLTSASGHPALTATMNINQLKIDHVDIPDLVFRSSWQEEQVRLLLFQQRQPIPLMAANYSPATRRIDGHIDIRNIDLSLLDTHYKRALSATKGRADLNAKLEGTLRRGGVELTGDILVHDYSAQVDFLGVRYAAAPQTRLKIEKNIISADKIPALDPEGNSAVLTAEVDLRRLKNVSYNFNISTPNILALDTSRDGHTQFYGHVYVSATASLTGSKQGAKLSATAATRPGSSFFMPLNDKNDITEVGFLTFAGPKERTAATRRRGRLSCDIELTVEPNTTVELLIDPRSGHRLQSQGSGLLNLNVSPRDNEFSIYGDYRIDEGTYLFTLENIIEKPFTITPGSTIQWAGNPRDALLNITATYSLKTSIGPAVSGTGYDSWRMRIPVECGIHLTDRLSAPTLSFDITAPDATPETRNILSSFLDTPEMTATQFFFLMATGNFYDYDSGGGDLGAVAGTATAFDFLSNRIMGLIPTGNLNIGIRYRPQTETTSDEWGLGLTQQLWGERLLLEIEGNYDTRNNQSAAYTENMRNFTGDFYLTGILNRRGTLRAKAFTRTITRFDENQGLQESGAGIYFTEEFNTFGDWLRWLRPQRKTNNY